MKAVLAEYDADQGHPAIRPGAEPEDWLAVCARFQDDVERLQDAAADLAPYTGLYACCDAQNRPTHYLVEESPQLHRIRRKTFLRNLGQAEGSEKIKG